MNIFVVTAYKNKIGDWYFVRHYDGAYLLPEDIKGYMYVYK